MKLQIDSILTRLDQNDFGLYADLSTDADTKKELEKNISWLIPQWVTGAYTPKYQYSLVLMFDELCNEGWQTLYNHPELQTKLLATVGDGKVKHKFYRRTQKKDTPVTELLWALQQIYEDFRAEDVALWCKDADMTDVTDLMDSCGIQMDSGVRYAVIKQFEKVANNGTSE